MTFVVGGVVIQRRQPAEGPSSVQRQWVVRLLLVGLAVLGSLCAGG